MNLPTITLQAQTRGLHQAQARTRGLHQAQTETRGLHQAQTETRGLHQAQTETRGLHQAQTETRGLHQAQARTKNNNVRKTALFCAAVLLVSGVVFSYMWAMHKIEVENILQSRTVDVVINEEFDELIVAAGAIVTKEVSFENTGSAAVFLRFTYAQYWETADELLEGYTDSVTLNWVNDSFWDNWYDGGDGWYYYKSVLAAGDSVDILSSVTFSEDIPEAYYNLFFQVETVQVSDESAVNTSVTETLFGITGTLSSPTISNGAVTSASVEWSVISDEA